MKRTNYGLLEAVATEVRNDLTVISQNEGSVLKMPFQFKNIKLIYFFFLALGFEIKALCLLGRCSTT
jgi:hypothetical protein